MTCVSVGQTTHQTPNQIIFSAQSAQKCPECPKVPRVPKNVKKCPEHPKVPKMARKCPELPNLKKFYYELFFGTPCIKPFEAKDTLFIVESPATIQTIGFAKTGLPCGSDGFTSKSHSPLKRSQSSILCLRHIF